MIPMLLPRLREKHPGIILTMVTGASAEMLQALQENEVELALVGSHVADKTVDLIPLRSDPLVLVVSCEHSWARQGRIALEQLFAEPLIVRESGSGSGQALESALSQAGHDPAKLNISARLGSNEAVLQATASGFGCAFVSELSVQKWSAGGDLRPVEIEGFAIDRWIWLATLKGRSFSPAAQAFVEFLKACCRD
jgi:DNA-binding transcriptional LysR family regulator